MFTHRIDAWTFCFKSLALALALALSVSVSVCLTVCLSACLCVSLSLSQRTSAPSTVSAVIAATVVLLQSHKHSALCRHLRVSPTLLTSPGFRHFRDLKSRTCYVLYTQSLPKQRRAPTSSAWSQLFLGRCSRTAAPCQYHPGGTASHPSQSPRMLSYPWYVLEFPNHLGNAPSAGPMDQHHLPPHAGDLMHCQYRLSVVQWNPRAARKNDTQIISTACGRFHAVLFSLHHSSTNNYLSSSENLSSQLGSPFFLGK